MLHDSGKRQEFATGAVRDTSEGKGRFDLIPPVALLRVAKIYEAGCNKYGERNFEKGIPVSRCCDSAMRHLVKYIGGHQDEDHLAAVIFNVMAVMLYEEKNTDMCNLPWQKAYSEKFEEDMSARYRTETREEIRDRMYKEYIDSVDDLKKTDKPSTATNIVEQLDEETHRRLVKSLNEQLGKTNPYSPYSPYIPHIKL